MQILALVVVGGVARDDQPDPRVVEALDEFDRGFDPLATHDSGHLEQDDVAAGEAQLLGNPTVELVRSAEAGVEVHHVGNDDRLDAVAIPQRVATVRVDDDVGQIRQYRREALLDDLAHSRVSRLVAVAALPVEVVVVRDGRDTGEFDDPLECHPHREVARQGGRVLGDQHVDPGVGQPPKHVAFDRRRVSSQPGDQLVLVGLLDEERVGLLADRRRMGEGQHREHGGSRRPRPRARR